MLSLELHKKIICKHVYKQYISQTGDSYSKTHEKKTNLFQALMFYSAKSHVRLHKVSYFFISFLISDSFYGTVKEIFDTALGNSCLRMILIVFFLFQKYLIR